MLEIVDKQAVAELLGKHGLTPNKALGQNFLTDADALNKIIEAVKPDGRSVLEIGPGMGALTRSLAARADRVMAVEIDAHMVEILKATLMDSTLHIVNRDILKLKKENVTECLGEKFIAVGNLPYYITTPIAQKLMLWGAQEITVMVQREAAERFFAKPGDKLYGPLAILYSLCYKGELLFELSPASHFPQPEVNSCVLHFESRNPAFDREKLWRFANIAFSSRRKMLFNNIAAEFADKTAARNAIEAAGLAAGARAEELPCEKFVELMDAICL